MPSIRFFYEDVDFQLENAKQIKTWLTHVINLEFRLAGELNYIFCSDDYLLQLNQEYLQHDTYTDIITFNNSHTDAEIAGDIFISIERVIENSKDLGVDLKNELCRVMVHGVLHLIGYKDKKSSDKLLMRYKENEYLSLLRST